jgi:hypothetical protein
MLFNNNQQAYICPRCFNADTEENVRTAQFGGATGGQPNPFSPGSKPPGAGGTGSKNYGINNFSADKTFDSILSQTHNPPAVDENRNFESRLEVFHKHHEEDMIPYWLTPDEREKLRIKKEIRRRHKNNEDAKKMVETNSVPYIKQYFPPRSEHITPKEVQLSNLHKYKDGAKIKFENELPEVIRPERIHMAQARSHGRSNPFWDETWRNTDEENAYPNFDNIRMHTPVGLGNAKLLEKGSDLDEYLNEAYTSNWGGADGPNETNLIDYPNADNIGDYSWGFGEKIPSSINKDIDSELDAFTTIEQQLEKTKRQPSPNRNPNDPYSYWSAYEMAKGTGTPGEPLGATDTYSGGSFNPSPIPR